MSTAPITLLLTNSTDDVSDLIVNTLGPDHIFRYNLDRWQDYKLRVTGETIELEDAQGRRITDADVAKFYRRRPSRASELHPDRPFSEEDRYMEEEVSSAWNEIMNLFHTAGKVVLVSPFTWLLLGKLEQLRIASRHFPSTPFSFLINRPDALRPGIESVVKSFNFKYGAGSAFYSKKVREEQLDPGCPWFLTDLIEAQWDVTVVFVRDQLFAFALDRSTFLDKTIDWRLAPVEHALRAWQPFDLPQSVAGGIFAFMRDAGAHYARLDFLRAGDDFIFLEANFVGEWGWLDPQGRHGLRDKILHEIDPRTPCVSCPRPV